MNITAWLESLPTDAIRNVVNAYRDAYDKERAMARDAGVETSGVWESEARRNADRAFKDALVSLIPKNKSCACEKGSPCDYHRMTCIICFPQCKGHPA